MALALAALFFAACGENAGDGTGQPTPAETLSPEAEATRTALATRIVGAGPSRQCLTRTRVPEEYNLDLKARWKGEKIEVEGSVDLPGPATVSWFICQDNLLTPNFRFSELPKLDDGKISGASVVMENPRSPIPFDRDAEFTVVVFAQDADFGIPYFIVGVPVEGQPD